MEIINSNSATLSNYEVFVHVQKIKAAKRKHQGQLATITYETLRYLEDTPCKHQNAKNVLDCLKALDPFNLNKSEKLMLINTPPTTPLEIQLMIEESEERLTEEQVSKILEIITEHFPFVAKQIKVEEEQLE
ncbi:DNA-directed RNA polymerase III subunit RPC9 [Cylas formicarius]|uniref:DNA-directed RNA polymerase III subunit RPC9 n=1 Tax=Cylas formicarius TaxID=197179 RepID=UPI002958AA6D|nr:DNA-directed RNA polymerase III subunit RPC9 [Cylas formicarius]